MEDDEKVTYELYTDNVIEFKTNISIKNYVDKQNITKPQKILKNEFQVKQFLKYIYESNMVNPLQQTDKEIKNIIPENKVLLDWGSKTYERIGKKILNSNCVMIIGKFSPSDVDDVYEKYGVITSAIHDRKTYLKENFEMMDIEDKKPIDDLKSRKFLLNFFLKSKTTYDLVKYHFKQILNKLSGANPNVNFIIIYYLIIIINYLG